MVERRLGKTYDDHTEEPHNDVQFLRPEKPWIEQRRKGRQAVLVNITPDNRGKKEWATQGLALGVYNYLQQLNSVEIGVLMLVTVIEYLNKG